MKTKNIYTPHVNIDTNATPAPGAERPAQFRKVVEWLHHKMAAAQNMPYEEGDVCLECADAVRDELVPLVREALAAAPPAPPCVQDFNARFGGGVYVVTGEHQRTAFFDKEAAEKYLATQNHQRFKIVEYSKTAPQFGPGDYSCAVCGLGMVEPCEHWKEAAEVKELIRRGHSSAERVRELELTLKKLTLHMGAQLNIIIERSNRQKGSARNRTRRYAGTVEEWLRMAREALPPSTGEKAQ